MIRRRLLLATALAAGLTLSGTAVAVHAGSDPFDAGDVVGVLDQTRVAADALPAGLALDQLGQGGVVATSSRLLGTDAGRTFWVARDATGSICLVAAVADKTRLIATACQRVDRVAAEGLLLGFQSAGPESVAYLLPDGTDVDGLPGAWNAVGENVVVATARDVPARGTQVTLPGGDLLELLP